MKGWNRLRLFLYMEVCTGCYFPVAPKERYLSISQVTETSVWQSIGLVKCCFVVEGSGKIDL